MPAREEMPEMSDASWDLMKIIASKEALHDDLRPWIEVIDGVEYLRHPWVYQIHGVIYGLANKQYELKSQAIKEAIQKKKWYTYVFLHERPYRADALVAVRDQFGDQISNTAFWSLVGSVWVDSENIWQNFAEWDDILNTERPRREYMMTKEERAVWRKLPNQVTVYRGSIPDKNEGGLSWTLNRNVAKFFAKRFANVHHAGGVIDTATVPKQLVVAYFDGRNEEEIVVEHAEAVTITDREHVAEGL